MFIIVIKTSPRLDGDNEEGLLFSDWTDGEERESRITTALSARFSRALHITGIGLRRNDLCQSSIIMQIIAVRYCRAAVAGEIKARIQSAKQQNCVVLITRLSWHSCGDSPRVKNEIWCCVRIVIIVYGQRTSKMFLLIRRSTLAQVM